VSKLAVFNIFGASAGSGKTFTIVKEYLSILLKSQNIFHFRNVLAITFTNKAAKEMKDRILQTLQDLAKKEPNAMLEVLMQETGLDAQKIQIKSKRIVEAIISDYSSFDITTIDSFTHRIIRSFAFDLGLSLSFDIEMDTDIILQKAVDSVIEQIGKDPKLTKALISFSHQRSADDKAWDISQSLMKISKILLNEPDKQAFNSISDKQIDDYTNLHNQLGKELTTLEQEIQQIGISALDLIVKTGLEYQDFYRSMLPKHFATLANDWRKSNFFDKNSLRKRMLEGPAYTKSKAVDIKYKIDGILPQLETYYFTAEKLYSRISLLQLFRESLVPMSVLSYINTALEQIKYDDNIRLINEFNELIYNKIKDEPAPFIYERLGEKYQNYFIDEMQDTSVLQWNNLKKLIDNALAQEGGSLLLVGDVKQAIYRWRGGESEQFINLSDPEHQGDFQIPKNVAQLDTNYRSFSNIIEFNNSFFQHISGLLLNEKYADIYKNENNQKTNQKKGGYVQIEFVDIKAEKEIEEDSQVIYPKKVFNTIKEIEKQYQWKDICILVRKNKEGAAVADYLTQQGIAIISSDSLLLSNNVKVDFLANLLQSLHHSEDKISRYNLLDYIFDALSLKTDKHDFIKERIYLDETEFFLSLVDFGFRFIPKIFHQKPLYDALEYGIRSFKLVQSSDAYVQYFMDAVLDFQIKKGSDLSGFLSYWELHKEKLSISIPEGINAVRIMTIHKSKGLQFPVVIYPYDLNIFKQMDPNIWYPIAHPEKYAGFTQMLLPYRPSLKYVDEVGNKLYEERQETLQFDSYNLLYVSLTRAVEQLYIITERRLNKDGENTNYFSGLFINYLKLKNKWDEKELVYSFGEKERIVVEDAEETKELSVVQSQSFISTDISDHQVHLYEKASILWGTEQGEAIDYGNLIHEIFAHIYTDDDVISTLQTYVNQGVITNEEKETLKEKLLKVVQHPQLATYYQYGLTIYNEREIVNTRGISLIPDRVVVFPNNEAVVIDYKTGLKEAKHQTQISGYATYLTEMGYRVINTIIVYIGDEIKLVFGN